MMTSIEGDIPPHPTHKEADRAMEFIVDNFLDFTHEQEIQISIVMNYLNDAIEECLVLRSELERIAEAEPTHRASIQRALAWKPGVEG